MNTNKTLKKLSLVMTLGVLFFSNPSVSKAENPINENAYDSIYRYSALESKIRFPDVGNVVYGQEELSEVGDLVADVKKELEIKKLQDIIEKQNFSAEEAERAMDVLSHRDKVTTFLVGNHLGTLRFQLVQIKDQITALNTLALKSTDSEIISLVEKQMGFAKEEQTKVENFLLKEEDKFNLFGWFVAMI